MHLKQQTAMLPNCTWYKGGKNRTETCSLVRRTPNELFEWDGNELVLHPNGFLLQWCDLCSVAGRHKADQWRTHPARILGSTHVFQKGSVLATWNVKTLSSLPILTWNVQVETAFWESENFVMRGSIWIATHQIFEGLGSWHGSIWKWRCPLLPTYLHGFET